MALVDTSPAPDGPRTGTSRVRILGERGVFSTEAAAIFRPQPGDGKVVQIRSTGSPGGAASGQVSRLWICGRTSSTDCGREVCPQSLIQVVHRQPTGSCPLPTAFPHPCPLFGNATPSLTGSSESRHTNEPGWPVGNVGKAGDGAGEKSLSAVHRVCRTFPRPQKHRVVHGCRPQAQWTKNRV